MGILTFYLLTLHRRPRAVHLDCIATKYCPRWKWIIDLPISLSSLPKMVKAVERKQMRVNCISIMHWIINNLRLMCPFELKPAGDGPNFAPLIAIKWPMNPVSDQKKRNSDGPAFQRELLLQQMFTPLNDSREIFNGHPPRNNNESSRCRSSVLFHFSLPHRVYQTIQSWSANK